MKRTLLKTGLKTGLKATGAAAVCAAVMVTAFLANPERGRAQDEEDAESAKVKIGLAVAPVPLNLEGKNRTLVGLGSYMVNVASDCNGCHTSDAASEFVFGGVPYFGQHPTKVNPDAYLSGGNDFGSLIPGSASIVSRNLTPDKDGNPAGLASFDDFFQIMTTGVDADKWHPTCAGAPGAHCIPAPFDGSLLQIMPWPGYKNMTRRELRAIYTYLSAIPCLEGDPGNPEGADTKGKRCN